jgi:hypothetical protein
MFLGGRPKKPREKLPAVVLIQTFEAFEDTLRNADGAWKLSHYRHESARIRAYLKAMKTNNTEIKFRSVDSQDRKVDAFAAQLRRARKRIGRSSRNHAHRRAKGVFY